MTDFREAAESIPVTEIAEAIRTLPPEEIATFRTALELVTRDTSKPLGRGTVAAMTLAALNEFEMFGTDPVLTLRTFVDAIRLADTPAASSVSIWGRIAANRPETVGS